jgi:DNA-binding transcriptional LysR family regulator
VEPDARNAGLVRIEAETQGPTQPLFLAYHHELRKAPHIRAALEAIEKYCRKVNQGQVRQTDIGELN